MAVPNELERRVRERAKERCEYCRLPQTASRFRHVVDHIIARKHGGTSELENLALACGRCNLHKGANIAGIDPATGTLCRLFNPRKDRWEEHFAVSGATLTGLTPIGRATVRVLVMNHPNRVAARQALLDADEGPSS